MTLAALELTGLSYSYGQGALALQDISFRIDPGERVALLGPNGAGKSTLLWCLVGVLRGEGTVAVDGIVLRSGTEAEIRGKLGLAFAEPEDQLFMPTVSRDVTFGPLAAGVAPEEAALAAERAIERVGLPAGTLDRPAHELSSGERRRAALASILVMDPVVLALDEPTNSLDARGRASLSDILMQLPCAQLIATHDLEFARALCARALVVVNGRLVSDTSMGALVGSEEKLQSYGLAAPIGRNDGQSVLL